jgi:osmotically-inducible protein OsmY
VPESPTDSPTAEPDEYVAARIKGALAHDERVAALDIEVHVVGNLVVLDGAVPTEERRHTCAEIAHAVVQDSTVDNRLVVVHAERPSSIEDVT